MSVFFFCFVSSLKLSRKNNFNVDVKKQKCTKINSFERLMENLEKLRN